MADWAAAKDSAVLDDYSKENPRLNLGYVIDLGAKGHDLDEKIKDFVNLP